MAWTTIPRPKAGEMITASWLNTYLRDNLNALSTHQHSGSGGDGNDEMAGLDYIGLDDAGGNPSADGRLQRNGSALKFFTTAGGLLTVGRAGS